MTKKKSNLKSTLFKSKMQSQISEQAAQASQAVETIQTTNTFANHPGFNNDIRVFQIYFKPEQLHMLEPEFIPYDNALGSQDLLEYGVFKKLYESNLTKDCKYWGALSWRFREKAMLNAGDVLNMIQANPGYDLYFMNPEPQIEGLYENLWIQGSTAHPNFIPLVEQLFDAVGMDKRATTAYRHTRIMAAANYFIGSKKFWDAYIHFIDDFLAKAEKNAPAELMNTLRNTNADPRNLHVGANYFPFIIERLLTEFIVQFSKEMPCFKIELGTKKSRLQPQAHDLEWLKNQALETRDEKLLRVWVNYRNLYFKTLYGNQLKG